ncbi:MAG: hypothetical protein SGILL_002167 [Bacillariaceae sp.]
MRVLGANMYGDSSVLEFQDVDTAELLPDDILVEVRYTDVNPVDLQKLAGRDDQRGKPIANSPHVPGYGGSGEVRDIGANVSSFSKGDSVCFLADPSRRGSYASHIVVNANCVAKLGLKLDGTLGVPLREAACVPVAGLTAYETLQKCCIRGKKSLLVVGGAGGVGSWTIVLAKVMDPDIVVVATASTEEQREWCKSLGVSHAFPHDEIEKHLQGGRAGSMDAIVCLTEPTPDLFSTLSNVIKPYGTICLVVAGKSIESMNLGFCFFKCANVVTETVFSSIRTDCTKIDPAEEMSQILEWIADGRVTVPLSPDLATNKVEENLSDALKENGVLKVLSQPHGKRGKLVMNVKI